MHRRQRKIRRTGRHTTPSQVEKVAEAAGKAAPAAAIVGVLVAAPAANAATSAPAKATTVAEQVHTAAKVTHDSVASKRQVVHKSKAAHVQRANRTYTVEPGDSLASIAQKFYGNYNDWTSIYHANQGQVHNPNAIYPGEHLTIPNGASSGHTSGHTSGHRAKHSKTDPPASTLSTSAVPTGTLSCGGLERLWEDAGGSAGTAEMAAAIAMAESSGNQYAFSPTDDRGYWQINASWGPLSTFDALGNAKAAVYISHDGTQWSPWTTYTSGAYHGRC
jgi:LysM repeat protein